MCDSASAQSAHFNLRLSGCMQGSIERKDPACCWNVLLVLLKFVQNRPDQRAVPAYFRFQQAIADITTHCHVFTVVDIQHLPRSVYGRPTAKGKCDCTGARS